MKKILSRVVMAVAAVLLLSGCGINQRLTMNSNLNQTNVVLSQKNFQLQYSCLENPRDRGAWWAAVYGVAQSQSRLKRLSSSSSMGFM